MARRFRKSARTSALLASVWTPLRFVDRAQRLLRVVSNVRRGVVNGDHSGPDTSPPPPPPPDLVGSVLAGVGQSVSESVGSEYYFSPGGVKGLRLCRAVAGERGGGTTAGMRRCAYCTIRALRTFSGLSFVTARGSARAVRGQLCRHQPRRPQALDASS
jgi:hypothetical protein